MARIFISYSRIDEEFARRLAGSLSDLGAEVWIDVKHIPAGMNWSAAIQEGLDICELMVLVVTPDSMSSRNVSDEWQYYIDQHKPVVPVLVKPTRMHFQLSRLQYVSFDAEPYALALKRLYRELSAKGVELNREALPNLPPDVDTQLERPEFEDFIPLQSHSMLHGRYRILNSIGGDETTSLVYMAQDTTFSAVKRLVAIKEFRSHSGTPEQRQTARKQFELEAGLMATLNHRAIPTVIDMFSESHRDYITMQYIDGTTLETLLSQIRDVPVQKVITWALELTDVLAYLHNQNPEPVLFRDLTPANIMIDGNGHVRLIDFGLTKIFDVEVDEAHYNWGTEGYMAPEQYKGNATPVSDIYGLGATLHHVLTHTDPTAEKPHTFHLRAIRSYNPEVPEELERIVMKALNQKPDDRYQTAAQMENDLRRLLRTLSITPNAVVEQQSQVTTSGATESVSPMEAMEQIAESVKEAAQPEMMSNGKATASTPVSEAVQENAAAPTPEDTMSHEAEAPAPVVAWKFHTGDELRAPALATGERVYFGSYDTNVRAVKAEDGELVWKYPTKGGIATAPACDDSSGLLLVGSEDHSLYALNAESGKAQWSHQTGGRVRSGPRLYDGRVYVGSDDGKLYALEIASGKVLWTFESEAEIRTTPAVTADLVLFGNEAGQFIALDHAGKQQWTFKARQAITSSPLVDGELCFVGCFDQHVFALQLKDGDIRWRGRTEGPVISSPAADDEQVYIGSGDGRVYAFTKTEGEAVWQFKAGKPVTSSPLLLNRSLYVGGTGGSVYKVSTQNGSLQWKYETEASVTASPCTDGQRVFIGSTDHTLYALEA